MDPIYLGPSYSAKAEKIVDLMFKTNKVYEILDKSSSKKSEIGFCKDMLSNLLKNYLDIKDKIPSLKSDSKYERDLCNNLFAMNRSASMTLDDIAGKEKTEGRFRKDMYEGLESVHMPDEEKNNRLVLSNTIDTYTKRYFSEDDKTPVDTLIIYLKDLKETTSKKIRETQDGYMKNLDSITVVKEGKKYSKNQKKIEESYSYSNKDVDDILFLEKPDVTLDDIAGLTEQKEEIETMANRIKHPKIYWRNASDRDRGIIFYGPPGTGKTLLGRAMANTLQMNFVKIDISDIVSKYFGESEQIIREIFRKVKATDGKTIMFFDELDALAVSRENSYESGASRRIVNSLLSELDGFEKNDKVIPIGTTNAIKLIDKGIMRSGRFTKHIYVPLPDYKTREAILQLYIHRSNNISLERGGKGVFKSYSKDNYANIVKITEGWNGADISELIEEIKSRKSNKEVKTKKNEMIDLNWFINEVEIFRSKKHNLSPSISS